MIDATQHTSPILPGDCVPIPQVSVGVRDAHGRPGWVMATHVVPGLDLDGYGSPVWLVPPEGRELNQQAMWWRLFIQRGNCGYDLGIVFGIDDPVPASGISHGLRNFTMVESVAPNADDNLQGIGMTTYIFDGRRYVGGVTAFR